jgi:aminotransferase
MINTASEMEDVVHLSLGQPNFAAPDHIIDAHIDALRERKTGYTMDAGLPELLTALKEYYGERYGRQITEDNILITTGCTEAMYLALSAAAAPGRQFIIPDPAFPIYAPIIRMHGGEVRSIPTRAENGHQLDPQEVIDNFRLHTFGVVLNSPANPTGAVYPRETIEAIVEAAAYRDIYVFSDEVYDHLLLDDVDTGSVLQCATDLDHVVAASSFSKTWAMPGLRVGWVISSQGHIKKLRRYHTFTTTVANTPAQWAGVAALKGPRESVDDMVQAYRKRRDRVVELVEETPHLKGYKPQGAFYMLPELPASMDGTTVAMRLLEEAGVCTIPGSAFGESCNNSLRLSFSTSNEDIEEAFSRMNKWFRDLKV